MRLRSLAFLGVVLVFLASAIRAQAADPDITTQPASLTVDLGKPASFTVNANGATTLSYAWAHNGAAIPNATSPTYPITSVQTADQGVYTCTVADTAGTVTSDPATLSLQSVPALVNYQGMLTDASGNGVSDGQYVLQFRIWGDKTSADPSFRIWGRQSTVTVVGGKFNVILSDAMDPIDGETFAPNDIAHAFRDRERYLAITIKTVPPKSTASPGDILPRQEILSAPFAMQAQSASQAALAQNAIHADNASRLIGSPNTNFSVQNPDVCTVTTGNWTDVPGLSVSLTTTGHPVLILVTASGNDLSHLVSFNNDAGDVQLVRDENVTIGVYEDHNSGNAHQYVPSSMCFFDTPKTPGLHSYKIRLKNSVANGPGTNIARTQIVVIEL